MKKKNKKRRLKNPEEMIDKIYTSKNKFEEDSGEDRESEMMH